MSGGTVNIARSIWDDAAFKAEPFTEREAFMWLVMEASWKSREVRVGSFAITLQRGQLAASTRFMAKAWSWPEARVRRYLERVKNRRMIDAATDAGVTVLTVCKYEEYQGRRDATDAPQKQKSTQQRRTTDANDNKDEIREEEKEMGGAAAPARSSKVKYATPSMFPSFIRPTVAAAFLEHRQAMRKRMTHDAAALIHKPLLEIQALGVDPNEALELAILHGWQTVNPKWEAIKALIPNPGGPGNGQSSRPAPRQAAETQRVDRLLERAQRRDLERGSGSDESARFGGMAERANHDAPPPLLRIAGG